MKVVLHDPSIRSTNPGDEIILQSVQQELSARGFSVAQRVSTRGDDEVVEDGLQLLCGTNILASKPDKYSQWTPAKGTKNVHLLGTGWTCYQMPPRKPAVAWWKNRLAPVGHSVRDAYSAWMGGRIARMRNTGCPTTWGLDGHTPEALGNAERAILTVTHYRPNPTRDRKWIGQVLDQFEEVVIWPQGEPDLGYIESLGLDLQVLEPTLSAFDKALASKPSAYVGTRLHGGVRALQHRLPASIIIVDNRSREMGRGTGLPVAAARSWSKPLVAPQTIRVPQEQIEAYFEELKFVG